MANQDDERRLEAGFSRTRPHANLTALRFAVFAIFALLALRLVDMQILNGKEYAERATNNHIAAERIIPNRGLIYDRNGEALVENTGTFTATVVPALLPNPAIAGGAEARHRIYLEVEAITGVPVLEIQARVAEAEEAGAEQIAIPVARNLSHETALMLSEAAIYLPGVDLVVTPWREYTDPTFSHLLGYIGAQTAEDWATLISDGYAFNEPIGRSGLEAFYQDVLRGVPGSRTAEINAEGTVLNTLGEEPARDGSDLQLSIDSGLQTYMAERLQAALDADGNAKVAAAVAMDPDTGEILGMVSLPGYDNNIFADLENRADEYEDLIEDDRNPLLNHVLSPVAPGSTFKLITAAAGLEEGTLTPSSGISVDSLALEVVGENGVTYYFRDWAVHGYVDLRGAISVSSNHFFYMASCGLLDRGVGGLGSDVEQSAIILGRYANEFGLGQLTGIDIVGSEASGIIPSPEWKRRMKSDPEIFNPGEEEWFYADTCFMGIGQGDVTATPLQIAMMTSAVANGGYLVKPHIVDKIIAPDGTEQEIETEWNRVDVSDEHLQVIREGMLQSVSGANGAARNAAVSGVQVAGKTGTAEFTRPGSPVLLNHAWFTGFAPYDNPEIVVAVYVDIGWGGSVAAPIGGDIIEYYMENVSP